MAANPEYEQELITRDTATLEAVSAAEINQQIVTARQFPRSIKRFREECLEMVTLSEAIARECVYALPRDGKVIEGPSARFAEVVASAWGNCRAGARTVSEDEQFVTAQGAFHDLERNVAVTYEVRRRITDRKGRRYSADMIGVTSNAACSIALRNAVLKGVPKAFWSDMYIATKRTIAGDVQTLKARRKKALELFGKQGMEAEQVCRLLGIQGHEDIGIDHLVVLSGILTALQDGDTTVAQLLSEVETVGEQAAQGLKDRIQRKSEVARGKNGDDDPAPAPQEREGNGAPKPREDGATEVPEPAEREASGADESDRSEALQLDGGQHGFDVGDYTGSAGTTQLLAEVEQATTPEALDLIRDLNKSRNASPADKAEVTKAINKRFAELTE